MAKRRTKLTIVPRILKNAVTVGVIPACVASGGCAADRGYAPVVAAMPGPPAEPPDAGTDAGTSAQADAGVPPPPPPPPPVVAQMIAPVVAAQVPPPPPPTKKK